MSFRSAQTAQIPRRVSFKNAWKAQHLQRVSFKEACNAKTFGGCRLSVQIYCFGTVLEHFEPKTAQMLHMVSFGAIFDDFRPLPDPPNRQFRYQFGPFHTQDRSSEVPDGQFGSIFDNFRPKAIQMLQMLSLGIISDYFGSKAAHGLFFERTLHSK